MQQVQNKYGQITIEAKKPFRMIDNYLYLYHTDTLIALPLFPETLEDTMNVSFNEQIPLSRSAPIYSYSNSGPRTLQISLPLHRDMMNQINVKESNLDISELQDDDYVDLMIKQIQSAALPRYAAAEKMVNPPLAAVRFGSAVFCKGVINGAVSVVNSGPILSYPDGREKYAMATVGFSISEVDPYDAETVALLGGFRGLSTTLDRRVWRVHQ